MTTSNEIPPRDPKTIWKEQKMTAQTLTPTQLENRHHRLEGRIRLRNRVEYIAGGAVFVGSLLLGGWFLLDGPNLVETVLGVGTLLLGIGALVACLQLRRRTGGDLRMDGAGTTLTYYRADLACQRDALRSIFGWYIAPFLPGFVLIYGSVFLDPKADTFWAAAPALVTVAFLAWVLHINRKAADCIDEELRALDESSGSGA
jgi:hypothetical protein